MSDRSVRVLVRQARGRVSITEHAGSRRPLSVRAWLEGLSSADIRSLRTWANWIDDQRAGPLETARPTSLQQMVWLVDRAIERGQGVRAVGAGHSTSAAARPDHLLIDMSGLSGAEPARWVAPPHRQRRLMTVLAGTRVKTLNLDLMPAAGLALPSMGSFDGQTVSGALSTGTHGSSIHFGPMADLVRSIDLVVAEHTSAGPRACAYRVEPSDGITDPAAFAAHQAEHGLRLLQDDGLFHASVVSFGAVGLVHALTLELVEPFWLREQNEAMRWSDVRRLLRPETHADFAFPLPPLLADNDYVEFLVNSAEVQPASRPSDPMCLLRRRNAVDAGTRPASWRQPWPPRRQPPDIQQLLTEAFVRPRIDNRSGKVLGTVRIGNRVANHFEQTAAAAPFAGGGDRSRSDLVLRRERDDTDPADAPAPPPEAISSEIAVPLDRTIEAVDEVLAVMRANGHFYAVPFGVRFVGPSPHLLAPQHGRPTALIEVPMLLPKRRVRRRRDRPAFRAALEDLERALCYAPGHLDGRPQWGQHHMLTRERVVAMYPGLAVFEAARLRFNAAGVFDNAHTRQLGL